MHPNPILRCAYNHKFLWISKTDFQIKFCNLRCHLSTKINFLIWDMENISHVFLWILRNFQEHLFYRTPPVAASETSKICMKNFIEIQKSVLSNRNQQISQCFHPIPSILGEQRNLNSWFEYSEAVAWRCSIKRLFWKYS